MKKTHDKAQVQINRLPVESSMIKSMGHAGTVLDVEFANGSVYRYQQVPQGVYLRLLAAQSIGRHFAANVRDQFPCEQLYARQKD